MNASHRNLGPTIARIWRGRTRAARADEYAEYLYEYGIKPLEEKALGVQILEVVSSYGQTDGAHKAAGPA